MVMGVVGVWCGLVWLMMVEVELLLVIKEKLLFVMFSDIVCSCFWIGKFLC